jgi:membrane protein DedA with SNARE-associated domain
MLTAEGVPALVAAATLPVAIDALGGAWAYATLAVTAFWGSELAPLLSGFAAMQGHLQFPGVVASVSLGAWAVMTALYALGRWRAAWVRLKARRAPLVVRRMLGLLRFNPWRSALLARFVFGGRILLPLACGAARVPVWIFVTGSAIASVVWAAVYTSLGWFFGRSALAVHGHLRRYEELVVAGVIVAVFLGSFILLRRRQRSAGVGESPLD